MKMIIIFILFFLSNIMTKKTSTDDNSCFAINSNWESMFDKKIVISDPSTCTSLDSRCCHLYVKQLYNNLQLENGYCFLNTDPIENVIRKFTNDFTDELYWYANFTNDNQNFFVSIGSSLNYTYYENFTCSEYHQLEDYSTYNITNCAKFKVDGTCEILNDYEGFKNFVANLYSQTVLGECTSYDSNGNCMDYIDSNTNNTALQPLLDILTKDYNLDSKKNETNTDNTSIGRFNWPGPCKPIPKVIVRVTCPPDYKSAQFLNFNIVLFLLIYLIVM
jgi:hypothetical protein